ncbi:Bug family tripartite tricarboxylate transporter substrate binding protein [Caenimonas soli]|uniref:Bug family tripartite tricarboxylate transporter substrate binding protein n=1 Tax=Caenimonas soli TaxID=2735555 RepID=UPI0015534F26|nr:tripartite tricarboxylate transporter substrate binding protein [Caenimonas soli]NPC54591.1 tripartite tricarboxylate transporter substrate binding protein [Caenimonas soli]
MNRRQLIAFLSLVAGTALPGIAGAQTAYPSGPVKVLVGFPPGTAADVATRVVTEGMAKRLRQPFIVENRAGAGSNIAARALVSSPPDGYTVFVATIANTINAGFPNSTAVDPVKDFMPVTMIGNVPNVLVAHPSLDVATVADVIRMAKAKPGDLSFASSGIGTSPHLSGELFSMMAGVKMVHVPYRGSTPAVTDLLAGQVQLMFAPASSVLQHVRAGKLKALAVTSPKRTAVAPELPTLDELGLKGFDTSVWIGLVAPARTPPEVTAKLRAAAHSTLDSPEVENVFKTQGIDVVKTSQEEFSRHLRSEAARWSKVIQAAGIKPE